MSESLRYALAYAERLGWRVLPLEGKIPRTAHGVHDATRDADQIRAWWGRWPTAGVGIATGGGLLVVDVDPRNGGDVELDALLDTHGALPDTVTCLTGGGGVHYYFAVPDGFKARKELCRGVDLKSDGGYVVAPPSVHPSGKRYEWEDSSRPGSVPIAPAPAWILETNQAPRDLEPATGPAAESFLARCFYVLCWLGGQLPNGAVMVRCPWADEHSDGRGQGQDSSTVILPPTARAPLGTFRCSHGHCVGRGTAEALAAIPARAITLTGDTRGIALAVALLNATKSSRAA